MVKRVAEFGIWLIVLFVPFELYFRVSTLGTTTWSRIDESGLLLEPGPNQRLFYRREGFCFFRYNADGLRGEDLSPEPRDGELRVAFLGDS